jgi:uncharacterized membrane protein YgcG
MPRNIFSDRGRRTRLISMRHSRAFIRLLVLFAVTVAALLGAPAALADPPFRVNDPVTDNANVLSGSQEREVRAAIDKLFEDRRIKLWVVYVESFDGQGWMQWSQQTEKLSDFGTDDALLAIATQDRAFAFNADPSVTGGSSTLIDDIRSNQITPALRNNDWAGAAIAAANGLNVSPQQGPQISRTAVLIGLALLVLFALALWWWLRSRRRRQRRADVAAAKRLDPTDEKALATVPLEALDELSKQMVVDVDNAVRTSDSELALAVEEFGAERTKQFADAVANAKSALAQAFLVRQTLDDASPEPPLEQRRLLTSVVVSAGRADQELESQNKAFHELRDLIINSPDRLDGLTQQMVALTARLEPAGQELAGLHQQFSETALSSVAGNVDTARQRLAFADEYITKARGLVSKPATDQMSLVDSVRAAEGALGQAKTLLDAVDSADTDINRAVGDLPARIEDIQSGIDQAGQQLAQPGTPHPDKLTALRDAAVKAADDARSNGSADPLGTFVRLTAADADLDQILATVTQQRQEDETQARMLAQAISTAQTRVRAVSDFIDTRRGSVGPEARTRLAEAQRQLEAALAKQSSNPTEAVAHANGAASLAAQAQSLANSDVQQAHRAYSPQYSRQSDLGSVLGGILIGNVLRGGYGGGYGGGWGGSWGGGRSPGRPTSYGGSSNSSSRSYGGGRF